MSQHELSRYLATQKKTLEWWRCGLPLKTSVDWQKEAQSLVFKSRLQTPSTPIQASHEVSFYQARIQHADATEPRLHLLNFVIVFSSLIFSALFVFLLTSEKPLAFILFAALSLLASTIGLFATNRMRRSNVLCGAKNDFLKLFPEYWKKIEQDYRVAREQFQSELYLERQQWNTQEAQRLAEVAAVSSGNEDSVKQRLLQLLEGHVFAGLNHVWMEGNRITTVFEVQSLDESIPKESKKLSEKTGKLIKRTKPKSERELEYETCVSGVALLLATVVLNCSPTVDAVRLALFSNSNNSDAFHFDGSVSRELIEKIKWQSIEPLKRLRKSGSRIYGGRAKKLSQQPEWLTKLNSLRIELGTP